MTRSASPCSWAAARASTRSRSRRRGRCSQPSIGDEATGQGRDRPRRGLEWELGAGAQRAGSGRPRRCRCPTSDGGCRPRSGRSTSSCRSCTARSERTAPCRGCSSSRACPTSARASPPRRSAWTRTCSRRSLRDSGIPVARNVTIRLGDADREPVRLPGLRQAARLGSSVGITKVHAAEELEPRSRSRAHDEKVLIEEFVDGIEVECSVLGNLARRRSPRSPARSSRTPSGTTTRPSTTRAAWT